MEKSITLPEDIKLNNIIFNEDEGSLTEDELADVVESIVEMIRIIDNNKLNIIKLLNDKDNSSKFIYHLETFYYLLREFCNYDLTKRNNTEKNYFSIVDNFLENHNNCYIDLNYLYEAINL